jgi:hypothetical protein
MSGEVNLYHITAVQNLPGIISSGGLRSKNQCDGTGVAYRSIAYAEVQERRAARQIPLPPYGLLHDYVPFYFGSRSPMLLAIHRGSVQGAPDQTEIVHLVTDVARIVRSNRPFVFTDGHAAIAYARYFNNIISLSEVDLPLMKERYWSDTQDDPNRKFRRQAEFLVHQSLPWTEIKGIGVYSLEQQAKVQEILRRTQSIQTPVAVRANYYY